MKYVDNVRCLFSSRLSRRWNLLTLPFVVSSLASYICSASSTGYRHLLDLSQRHQLGDPELLRRDLYASLPFHPLPSYRFD